MPPMPDLRFIRRQISGSRRQAAVFVLCVALSMITLVSLGSFSRSVHSSLLRDARALHAADIIIHSHAPLQPSLLAAVRALEERNSIRSVRLYEFYSVVRTSAGDASLLANLKVVEPGYPFYGTVDMASGRPFGRVLLPGGVVVEQGLLDRLGLRVGDRLWVGDALLAIRDVVVRESDRPVNFFALGPRVFVSAADLPALGLVGQGSRVEYGLLARVSDQKELKRITAELRAAAGSEGVRVETSQSADSRIKRFFDNLLFFLNLIGMFTLLLAGIGIQSTLTALLKEQERTIAIMKTVGAGSRFIIGHYFALALSLGLGGTLIGLAISLLLQNLLPELFDGLLPARVELTISAGAVAEGFLLGMLVVILFTALPLYRLKEVKPRAIFGQEEQGALWSRTEWLISTMGVLFFLGMVLLRIRELKSGLYFVLGMGLLVLISFVCAQGALSLVRRMQPGNLMVRQALKGLFRPGSATRSIIVTLTASLVVIFSITIVEKNLDGSFVSSFPPEAPNLFFIDIQPGQKADFARTLGMAASYYPIVRGSVVSINGEKINREKEQQSRGDNLTREFNLTYRETLLPDERILAGRTLFRREWPRIQVSVLDTVVKMHAMQIGDRIVFRVQGIDMEARIASIRTRTESGLQPFFYFVFPDRVLVDAPQTIFAAVRVDKSRIAALQNRVVGRFPNVSVIDLTETVAVFARIMTRLSLIVRFFTLFSVIAGFLIIVSSVFATRYARIREAVYFTILGAGRRFVLGVFALESLLLGLISALLALALSQAAGWIICVRVLDLSYRPYIGPSLQLMVITILLVVAVGLGASLSIVRQKPAAFLREQADE